MAPILLVLFQAILLCTFACLFVLLLITICLRRHAQRLLSTERAPSIGFLHPHPLAGGGGERVLWCAVQAAHISFPNAPLLVYGSFRGLPRADINSLVRTQFGLDISDTRFTMLEIGTESARVVDASQYPRFTLALQAFGAFRFGLAAFRQRPCTVLVETGNLAFAVIGPRALGARTVAYVHYPTISADMLALVRSRAPAFNNDAVIARSPLLSAIKAGYYHLIAAAYAVAAQFITVPLANSSWTRAHLRAVWGRADVKLVFPPCPISACTTTGEDERDGNLVLSLGQFRPEKNHALQLSAFRELEARNPGHGLRLVMVGGARGDADRARAELLRKEAQGLPVDVRVNVTREELTTLLAQASIGVHTMRDEHFGISVVELQAAGLLVVAHRSGGVERDIIDDGRTGFLAEMDGADYAERIWQATCALGTSKGEQMSRESRAAAARFSDQAFQEQFVNILAFVYAQ